MTDRDDAPDVLTTSCGLPFWAAYPRVMRPQHELQQILEKEHARLVAVHRAVGSDRSDFDVSGEYPGVYFAKWQEYIKVGSAWNVVTRMSGLRSGVPIGEIEPLGWIPVFGGGEIMPSHHEERIHRALAAYWIRGEWFRDCLPIRRFIDRYCFAWPR